MAYEYKIVSYLPEVKRGIGPDWSEPEQKLNELITEG